MDMVTQRKPTTVGEILNEEFLIELGMSQSALARQMGVSPRLVNEICNDRRALTAETAIMLATVFGNSAEFWLNIQTKGQLWEAHHAKKSIERTKKARPLAMHA